MQKYLAQYTVCWLIFVLTWPWMFVTTTVLVLLHTTKCSGVFGTSTTLLTVMSVPSGMSGVFIVWVQSIVFMLQTWKKTIKQGKSTKTNVNTHRLLHVVRPSMNTYLYCAICWRANDMLAIMWEDDVIYMSRMASKLLQHFSWFQTMKPKQRNPRVGLEMKPQFTNSN